MPKIDCLYNYVQAVNTDQVCTNNSVEQCIKQIIKIRNNVTDIIIHASNISNINNNKLCFQTDRSINTFQKSSALEVVIY